MKPSPLELLIYKTQVEHEQMQKALFAANLLQDKKLPKKVDKFIDGRRISYFDGKLESRNSLEEFLSEMMPKAAETGEMQEASTYYWSSTNIPPKEAVLVQELRVVENEIIVTNSYQFKTSYVKTKVND